MALVIDTTVPTKAIWRGKNFSSASVDYATFQDMDVPAGPGRGGAQVLRLACFSNASSGSATVVVGIFERSTGLPIWLDIATCTPTAIRQGAAGNSGKYHCAVSFAQTSSGKLDLLGGCPDDYVLKIGVTGFSTVAEVDLYWAFTSEL